MDGACGTMDALNSAMTIERLESDEVKVALGSWVRGGFKVGFVTARVIASGVRARVRVRVTSGFRVRVRVHRIHRTRLRLGSPPLLPRGCTRLRRTLVLPRWSFLAGPTPRRVSPVFERPLLEG